MGGPGMRMGGPGPMGGPMGPGNGPMGGPMGPGNGPMGGLMGPGSGPMGGGPMGGGPMGPRVGRGLLGQGPPLHSNAPKALMSLPVVPPKALLPTPTFPPGYAEGNLGEDKIKAFLTAQREALLGAVSVLEKKIDNRGQQQQNQQQQQQQQEQKQGSVSSFNASGSFFGQDSNPFRKDFPSTDSSAEPPFKKRRDTPSPNDAGKSSSGGEPEGKRMNN